MSHVESQEPIDAVVAELLEARRNGRDADCDAIVERHPELASELRSLLSDYDAVAQRFAPLREISSGTPRSAAEFATLGSDDTATPKLKAGSSFGDYDLLSEVARGGMGVVYKARQKSLNRLVALKMVLGDRTASTERDRFLVEARAVARLNHPHIVPIYEVGEERGQPYFTMEFFSGGSLRERIETLRRDPRAAAQMMVTVARAIEHAHRRGILHRDLKPTNVLLDERGEPHVTDFGLAKRLDEESDLTQAGAIVGTPSYMAPEQANAQTDLTTAVDVYGLGALMYELLTGRPPFKGNTPLETMLAAMSTEPTRPRKLAPRVETDLETICLKCLEKDPLARYGSADALADDIERWLTGKPIAARPVTSTERLVKWSRRQPLLASSLATVVAAAIGLLVLAGFLWQNAELRAQAVKNLGDANLQLAQVDAQLHATEVKRTEAEKLVDQQRQLADQQRAIADKIGAEVKQLQSAASAAEAQLVTARKEARRTIYAADMQLAHVAWQNENVMAAADLLQRYRDPDGQDDVRGFEWNYLQRQLQRARLSWPVNAANEPNFAGVLALAISPDATRLATVQAGNEIKLWNLADGKRVSTLSPLTLKDGVIQTNIAAVAFADGGKKLLATARKDSDPRKFEKMVADIIGGVGKFRIEAITDELELRTFALADKEPVRTEPFKLTELAPGIATPLVGSLYAVDGGSMLNVTAFDRSPDGKFLVLAASEMTAAAADPRKPSRAPATGRIIVWDIEHARIHAQQKSPVAIASVAFAPDSDAIALTTIDGAIGVGQRDLAQPPRLMLGHHGFVFTLRFTSDGRRLVSGGGDGVVILWDVAEARQLDRFRGHTAAVTALDLSPDGQTLVSASNDSVKVWDLSRPAQPLVLTGHGSMTPALAFSPDGRELISAESGGAAKIWSTADGHLLRELGPPQGGTAGIISISPRGDWLAWPTLKPGDAQLMLRDVATGDERRCGWKDRSVLYAAISADGRRIAGIDRNTGRIGLWNSADGKLLKEFDGQPTFTGIALSTTGELVATSGPGVVLWDRQSGESRRLLDAAEPTASVTFSSDDTLVAAASTKSLRIWDIAADKLRIECRVSGQTITRLAFSPDGKRLAAAGLTSGQVGLLKLWDTTIGREVFSANLPPAMITAIAISPDGNRLAAVVNPLDRAASIAGRNPPKEIYVWDASPVGEP